MEQIIPDVERCFVLLEKLADESEPVFAEQVRDVGRMLMHYFARFEAGADFSMDDLDAFEEDFDNALQLIRLSPSMYTALEVTSYLADIGFEILARARESAAAAV